MATTSLGFRFPAATDATNVPQDLQNLATDVNGYVNRILALISRSTATGTLAAGSQNTVLSGYSTITNIGDLTITTSGFTVNTPGFYEWFAATAWTSQTSGQVSVYPVVNGAVGTGDSRSYAGHTLPFLSSGVIPSSLTAGTTVQLGLSSADVATTVSSLTFGLQRVG